MQAKLEKRKIRIVMESLNTVIFMPEPCRKHNVTPTNVNGWKEKFFHREVSWL